MIEANKIDEQKWLNVGLVLGSMIVGYISFAFLTQLGDWFELESKIPRFNIIAQGIAIVLSIAFFFIIQRIPVCYKFLQETFHELSKVVWPNRQETVKQTAGIIVALIILGIVLGLIDLGVGKLLNLLHS